MQSRILPWIAIVLAVLALIWVWRSPLGREGPPLAGPVSERPLVRHVDVSAHDQADGTCAVDPLVPSYFDVRPGDFIVWWVDNQCTTSLELTKIARLRPGPAAVEPVQNHPPTTERTVPAGQRRAIRTRVRPNAEEGLYSYWIVSNDREAWFSICDEPPCPWDP